MQYQGHLADGTVKVCGRTLPHPRLYYFKALQKGAISWDMVLAVSSNILHSWVEVFVEKLVLLEGANSDKAHLNALQRKNSDCKTTFLRIRLSTESLQSPDIEWNLSHTFIQDKGINQDFGLFDAPDDFYANHQQKLGSIQTVDVPEDRAA